jgi:hypothetical protein
VCERVAGFTPFAALVRLVRVWGGLLSVAVMTVYLRRIVFAEFKVEVKTPLSFCGAIKARRVRG